MTDDQKEIVTLLNCLDHILDWANELIEKPSIRHLMDAEAYGLIEEIAKAASHAERGKF